MNRILFVCGFILLGAGAAGAAVSSPNAINVCKSKSNARVVNSTSECNGKKETAVVWSESTSRASVLSDEATTLNVKAAPVVTPNWSFIQTPSMNLAAANNASSSFVEVREMTVAAANSGTTTVAQQQYYSDEVKVSAAPQKNAPVAVTHSLAVRANTHSTLIEQPAR